MERVLTIKESAPATHGRVVLVRYDPRTTSGVVWQALEIAAASTTSTRLEWRHEHYHAYWCERETRWQRVHVESAAAVQRGNTYRVRGGQCTRVSTHSLVTAACRARQSAADSVAIEVGSTSQLLTVGLAQEATLNGGTRLSPHAITAALVQPLAQQRLLITPTQLELYLFCSTTLQVGDVLECIPPCALLLPDDDDDVERATSAASRHWSAQWCADRFVLLRHDDERSTAQRRALSSSAPAHPAPIATATASTTRKPRRKVTSLNLSALIGSGSGSGNSSSSSSFDAGDVSSPPRSPSGEAESVEGATCVSLTYGAEFTKRRARELLHSTYLVDALANYNLELLHFRYGSKGSAVHLRYLLPMSPGAYCSPRTDPDDLMWRFKGALSLTSVALFPGVRQDYGVGVRKERRRSSILGAQLLEQHLSVSASKASKRSKSASPNKRCSLPR